MIALNLYWKPMKKGLSQSSLCRCFVLLIFVFGYIAVGFGKEAEKVTVCALKNNPSAYNHKLVEVTGFVSHGFEDFNLIDPTCASWHGIWLEYGGRFKSGTIYCCGVTDDRSWPHQLIVEKIPIPLVRNDEFLKFDKAIELKSHPHGALVHATLVGRFFAGRRLEGGYGHFGCCSLLAIQEVKSLDPQDRADLDYGALPNSPVMPSSQPTPAIRLNGKRINDHLAKLATYGANPQGGVSRVAYSEADLQGRAYAIGLMKDAGLDVHIDAAGNIVGTRMGSDSALKPLLIGSHIDSVPMGGNYDGDVGSLSAIEVAQTLAEQKITLRHPLEVILFENEEGGTVGSQTLGRGVDDRELGLVSQSGKTIREGIRTLGGNPEELAAVRRQPGSIAGYVEFHIEQGGVLEREKIDIGVVEGIVGIMHSVVTIEGFANHAGTTPMDQRHDALLSAARFIDTVNQIVTSIPGRQVGTVGWIKAEPGAFNVIPGKVTLGLELRDLDEKKFMGIFERVRSEAEALGKRNQTHFSFSEPVITHPAPTDPGFRTLISKTAAALGFSTRVMPSGAGHDAQEIANLGPVGMIFIPSVGGISHSPKEFSQPQDIENGANVLLQTLLELDKR